MNYIEFEQNRPMDLILLGRVAIDFNPAYNDQVKDCLLYTSPSPRDRG